MLDGRNLLEWMVQAFILASAGSLSVRIIRLRDPRAELIFLQFVLAICVLLPVLQPWRHAVVEVERRDDAAAIVGPSSVRPTQIRKQITAVPAAPAFHDSQPPSNPLARISWTSLVLWTVLSGIAVKFCWLLCGLWRIGRHRIRAVPLYPLPESVQAAAAITHADAIFCVSDGLPGPVMLGWLTPVVLLPPSFLALGEEAQCGIACHELLHVRRQDWLITLIEEITGALLWFNPGMWLLLAHTRLVREQLVDAEVVRLTQSREPYIEALLAIARGGPIPDLRMDLAPTPLFLRRRHLTQRLHLLLQDVSISALRRVSSYTFVVTILLCAGWFAPALFPLTGAPQFREIAKLAPPPLLESTAQTPPIEPPLVVTPEVSFLPLPPDPHELATGDIHVAQTATERAAATSLLDKAVQNAPSHAAETPPFHFDVSFTASGATLYDGAGELAETWLSPPRWRWTANLGDASIVRIGSGRGRVDGIRVTAIPMRVDMLRSAIFWIYQPPAAGALIRTAEAAWNGKSVTCVLTSNAVGSAQTPSRLWEEREFCVDEASGLLQIHSIAPGIYTVYGYSRDLQFHGRTMPDRITIYVRGLAAVDASFEMTDAGNVDPVLVTATPEMIANGPVIQTMAPERFPMDVSNPFPSATIQKVIVHAEVGPEGNVLEEELCAASDPALAQLALDVVKEITLPHAAFTQRQAYINVRFHPAAH